KIIKSAEEHRRLPSAWLKATLIPLYKKKGSRLDVESYRPIAVTSSARKIVELAMIRKFSQPLDDGLSRTQGGFRRRRGTYEQVYTLHELIRAHRTENRTLKMAFLDIKSAYDTVARGFLWEKLAEKEVRPENIEALRLLFEFNSGEVYGSDNASVR